MEKGRFLIENLNKLLYLTKIIWIHLGSSNSEYDISFLIFGFVKEGDKNKFEISINYEWQI